MLFPSSTIEKKWRRAAMAKGRGSLSGRNRHARWQVWKACRPPILYVPARRARGTYRSTGPFSSRKTQFWSQGKSTAEARERRESPAKDHLISASGQVSSTNFSNGFELEHTHGRSSEEDAETRPREPGGGGGLGGNSEIDPGLPELERCHLNENYEDFLQEQANDFLHESNAAIEEILTVTGTGQLQCDLIELCCPPDSCLVSAMLDHGQRVLRVGPPAFDLKTKAGLQEVKRMTRKHGPTVLAISLPCGPFSPIQKLINKHTPKRRKRVFCANDMHASWSAMEIKRL